MNKMAVDKEEKSGRGSEVANPDGEVQLKRAGQLFPPGIVESTARMLA